MAARKRDAIIGGLSRDHKESIRAANILARVRKAAEGEIEMSPTQLQAAQLYLRKTIPDLSAVEQTVVNDQDNMTAEQIIEQIKALVTASPDMALMLQSLISKQTDEISTHSRLQ